MFAHLDSEEDVTISDLNALGFQVAGVGSVDF